MTAYRCRTLVPEVSEWKSVLANSPPEAAGDFFYDNADSLKKIGHVIEKGGDRREVVHFALVEVEGDKTYVARIFSSGIWRRGGVRMPRPTLKEIAEKLKWGGPAEELIEPGWAFEETYEDATARKL